MTALTGEPGAEAELRISVVVCTHNRAEKLASCLSSLGDQTLDSSSYEVVVVDDGSTDATPEVAERYAMRVIRNERNLGLAASRNVGVEATSGPVVAFTDDDCIADRDWLRQLLETFDDPEVLAAGGKITPLRTDHLLLRYYEASNPLAHNPHRPTAGGGVRERFTAYFRESLRLHAPPENEESLFMITGANMALRRSTFELVGGFDGRFRLGDEDTDFWLRLHGLRAGALLRYSPWAVVAHDYDPNFRDALRRSRAYGRAAAVAYLDGRRRLPTIFPFPLLILSSFTLAAVDLRLLTVPFALIVLLYPGWLRLALSRRNPVYVGFSLFQAAFELQTSAGFLGYLVREQARRLRARTS
jgi:glycosyltransferase involved in cell wall biosynthesis